MSLSYWNQAHKTELVATGFASHVTTATIPLNDSTTLWTRLQFDTTLALPLIKSHYLLFFTLDLLVSEDICFIANYTWMLPLTTFKANPQLATWANSWHIIMPRFLSYYFRLTILTRTPYTGFILILCKFQSNSLISHDY